MDFKNKLMLGGNIFGCFLNSTETRDILDTARTLGITAIDTADVYSEGLSERFIGNHIHQDRSNWFLATKAGLRSHASPEGLGKQKTIFRKIEESLKRLQTDYIDLYQMHHFDPSTPLDETLETLEQLISQGKILSAGVSNYSSEHLNILKTARPNCIKFNQIALNITNYNSIKPILDECKGQDISVIAYSSLVRGLFNEKYLSGAVPESSRAALSKTVQADLTEDFLKRLKLTFEWGEVRRLSLCQIALQWVCQSAPVRWAIVGVRSRDQLFSVYDMCSKKNPEAELRDVERFWTDFSAR